MKKEKKIKGYYECLKQAPTKMAGGGESSMGQFPQDLYGDDLVSAMINRVNFTVNHFHQVNFP